MYMCVCVYLPIKVRVGPKRTRTPRRRELFPGLSLKTHHYDVGEVMCGWGIRCYVAVNA